MWISRSYFVYGYSLYTFIKKIAFVIIKEVIVISSKKKGLIIRFRSLNRTNKLSIL
jgi:hypothetical protein